MTLPVMYHIPVCPFSQRAEILLELKGLRREVDFKVIDITQPRPAWLLEKTRGTTALPVLEIDGGRILKESLVIMQYLDDRFAEPRIAHPDLYGRAVENMLTRMEADFAMAGYVWVMNQDLQRRETLKTQMLAHYARLNDFLLEHAADRTFLFDKFGWAEAVFTPFFMRFWFLEYYEDFEIPPDKRYDRVRRWVDACLAHPAAQQVTREEVIKLYYDYAKGAGNGALLPGRTKSSFTFTPQWRSRPMPPADKYALSASDQTLGLVP